MTSIIKLTAVSGVQEESALCYLLQVDEFRFLLDCGWDESFSMDIIDAMKRYASTCIHIYVYLNPQVTSARFCILRCYEICVFLYSSDMYTRLMLCSSPTQSHCILEPSPMQWGSWGSTVPYMQLFLSTKGVKCSCMTSTRCGKYRSLQHMHVCSLQFLAIQLSLNVFVLQSRNNSEDFSLFTLDDVDSAFDKIQQLKYSQIVNLKGGSTKFKTTLQL